MKLLNDRGDGSDGDDFLPFTVNDSRKLYVGPWCDL